MGTPLTESNESWAVAKAGSFTLESCYASVGECTNDTAIVLSMFSLLVTKERSSYLPVPLSQQSVLLSWLYTNTDPYSTSSKKSQEYPYTTVQTEGKYVAAMVVSPYSSTAGQEQTAVQVQEGSQSICHSKPGNRRFVNRSRPVRVVASFVLVQHPLPDWSGRRSKRHRPADFEPPNGIGFKGRVGSGPTCRIECDQKVLHELICKVAL